MFSTVLFTIPGFLVLSFHATSELPKTKNGEVAIDKPPQGSVNRPVDHSWNRQYCFRLPVLYKLFRLLFKCKRFHVYVYFLFYNCVQPTQGFERKSCSHASPLSNKLSASIVRCQNLLNMGGVTENMEIALEALRRCDIGLKAASCFLSSSKRCLQRHVDGENYIAVENIQVIAEEEMVKPFYNWSSVCFV